jgi:import receptor subunit TOM20
MEGTARRHGANKDAKRNCPSDRLSVLSRIFLCTSLARSAHVSSDIALSQLNHSCAPSAKPAFTSGTAELHMVATRDIKAGEEVTVSYVDTSKRSKDNAMEARRRRRMELARGWHFACSCTRCEEEKITLNIVVPPKGEPDLPPQGSAKLEPAVERFMAKNAGDSGSEVE